MIKLINVSKTYKSISNSTNALSNINVEFEDHGFVFILGPSGSGKTTLLNVIGGLDKIDDGHIIIDNKDISNYKSHELDYYRNEQVGFIFQNYNLIDHLNIYENISLPLRIKKISNKEIKSKTNDIINKLGLEKEKHKYPNQVSGGQLQRAAIARALVTDPKIVLADEPTGALDSKNSKVIMDALKDISKDRLVIMVTHNEELAKSYASRIIRLNDGKIESQEDISINENKESNVNKKKNFKYISLNASLKLSLKNIFTKKVRTILTIIATSIGIISTCLVLMVSNSMTSYTEYAQKQALGSYPITISSNVAPTDNDEIDNHRVEYPDTNVITITNEYSSYYSHMNVFDNEYLDYVKNMDKSIYTVIDYGSSLNMRVLTYYNDNYEYLSASSYVKCLNDDSNYLSEEYDLLYGDHYPQSEDDIALVIDKNNCIDAYVLDYLGIDYKNKESYTFEEICEKEFKLISNNVYYRYDEEHDRYLYNSNLENVYQNAIKTLKISCVLRIKKSATTKLYQTGLLYTQKLEDFAHQDAVNSEIVIKQLEYGLDKNVFSGQPYQDIVTDFYTYTKEYLLENNLKNLSYYYNTSYIRIYTDKFENRSKINEYLNAYNIGKDSDKQIIYRDYMGSITEEFEKFIKILTNVLIIFSSISLLVSSIMIALVMYISVMERQKEIGILRCIGYSRINVGITFLTEATLIGFTSGVIGVIIARVAIKPILKFVSNVVEDLYSSTYDISTITKVNMNPIEVLLLVLFASLIAIIAALVPAIIASMKEPVKAIRHQGE